MDSKIPDLTAWQVAIAAALVIANAVVSMVLRLGMGRTLLLASVRTVVQLLLLGLVLEVVFLEHHWAVLLAIVVFMTAVAGWTAARRSQLQYVGLVWDAAVSVWLSSWLITLYALFAVIQAPSEALTPQYVIPFLGILLGNALNGISLGLGAFLERVDSNRHQIETDLALGATRWEAARDSVREAVRVGMVPIVNSMMVVGLVSLPGMMTGQLLAGASAMRAVQYQIVVMFLIAATTALGTVCVVLLSYRRLFNRDHQFLYDGIVRPSSGANRGGLGMLGVGVWLVLGGGAGAIIAFGPSTARFDSALGLRFESVGRLEVREMGGGGLTRRFEGAGWLDATPLTLRVSVTPNVSAEAAAQLQAEGVLALEALYADALSAYPGDVSKRIVAEDRFRPELRRVKVGGVERPYFRLFATERFGYGSSTTEANAAYRSLLGWVYCARSRRLYKVRLFVAAAAAVNELLDAVFESALCVEEK